MTRKQKRLAVIGGGLAVLGLAAGLVLYAISDTIVFFIMPSEVAAKGIAPGQRIRLGGLVGQGVVKHADGTMSFTVTDATSSAKVLCSLRCVSNLAALFREGQGAIAEGSFDSAGVFQTDNVLAKHDEKYMPKDVADRLKAQGVWKEGKGS